MRSTKVTKKDVVSSDMLIEFCSSGISQNSEDLVHDKELAMILIAYSGFLGYDERRNLKCCNVKCHDEYFSLEIESSKTDQYRSGNEVLIAKGESEACPYTMLHKYVVLADIY